MDCAFGPIDFEENAIAAHPTPKSVFLTFQFDNVASKGICLHRAKRAYDPILILTGESCEVFSRGLCDDYGPIHQVVLLA
jgi:hypothetical protein